MILYFTLKLKLELEMLLKTCEFGDTNICMVCVACSFERKADLDESPESLHYLAVTTLRITLFVFIRDRMGM